MLTCEKQEVAATLAMSRNRKNLASTSIYDQRAATKNESSRWGRKRERGRERDTEIEGEREREPAGDLQKENENENMLEKENENQGPEDYPLFCP